MAFCINCGAQLPEGAKFCAACGTPVAAKSVQPVEQENVSAEQSNAEPSAEDDFFSQPSAPPAETPAKPAKSIVVPAAVEASRVQKKSAKKARTPIWVPVVIVGLVFCIALVVGIFKFKDLIFSKEIVAGPGDASEITTQTNAAATESGNKTGQTADGSAAETAENTQTPDSPAVTDAPQTPAAEENPGVSAAAVNIEFPIWAMTRENINIRNGAGTGFDKKSKYFRGAIVVLYEEKVADGLTWYRVSKDGAKTEQWIADDGTWLDFADPFAAALIGDDLTEEINFSIQYTQLAKINDQYIWRVKTSQDKGTQSLILQNISDPASTEDFGNFINSDSSYEFLTFLWEQNDHKLVELKEITLAGYCRFSGNDADGKAFTKKGEVWYAAIGSKTANYFATKGDDGKLNVEETGLDKLFEAGWENCTEDEYKAIN